MGHVGAVLCHDYSTWPLQPQAVHRQEVNR